MLNAGYVAAEVILALPFLGFLLQVLGSWWASFFLLALGEALGHAAYYMWLAPRPASLPSCNRARTQLAEAAAALGCLAAGKGPTGPCVHELQSLNGACTHA